MVDDADAGMHDNRVAWCLRCLQADKIATPTGAPFENW
jgi:hypothetical protein